LLLGSQSVNLNSMPAALEMYYAPASDTALLPSELWPFMKILHSKIRRGLHASHPELLQDIQLQNTDQRIIQPYSLEPLVYLDNGWIRICLKLLCEQANTLLRAFARWWQARRQTLYLNQLTLTLVHVDIQVMSPRELMQPDLQADRIAWHFLSPMAFGPGLTRLAQQQRHVAVYPLPLPDRIVGDLLQRWNYFYPQQTFPESLIESADREMEILQLDQGQVQTLSLGQRLSKRGFTGSLLCSLPTDTQAAQQIMTLARYAGWAGVGRQTSLGLGWTRTELLT